jgi:uncharacterized membrane protein/transcription antitermination factor NusG
VSGPNGDAPQSAGDKPPPKIFAVRATEGFEQEVAEGIRERAAKERVEVRSVVVPAEPSGTVFVEADDLNRLSNLVAVVKHARGVAPEAAASMASIGGPFGAGGAEGVARQAAAARPAPAKVVEAEAETQGPKNGAAPRAGRDGAAAADAEEGGARKPLGAELPPVSERTGRLLNVAMLLPVAIVAVGLLVAPRIFWDGFLYPYFWRSIEADANNVGGPAEAYNVVDTLSYALILVPAVILIYRVLERLKIKVDARFVLMLTPFLILGGAARALEDAQYFGKPLTFAFISPIIYVAEGLLVVLLVVSSWWVVREQKDHGPARGALAWSAAFAPGAATLLYFQAVDTRFVAAPIPLPILLSALACAYLAGLVLVSRAKAGEVHGFVLIAGLLLLALTAYLIARWTALGGWWPLPASPVATRAGEVGAIVGLATLATALTLAGIYFASWRFERLALLLTPINVLVFFGQFLDGAATFWGIDMFHYEEKHVLPGFLIQHTGTAAVMFPLKLGFVLVVLLVTDVVYRNDLYDEEGHMSSFAGLLKLTVAALGMGPGTRDMLRLAMGV